MIEIVLDNVISTWGLNDISVPSDEIVGEDSLPGSNTGATKEACISETRAVPDESSEVFSSEDSSIKPLDCLTDAAAG
jgi:hypothetical protein